MDADEFDRLLQMSSLGSVFGGDDDALERYANALAPFIDDAMMALGMARGVSVESNMVSSRWLARHILVTLIAHVTSVTLLQSRE